MRVQGVLKEKPMGARWIAVTLTRGWDYLQVNTQANEIQSSIKYTILYGYQVSSVKLNTRSDEKEGTFSVIHECDMKINVEGNTR